MAERYNNPEFSETSWMQEANCLGLDPNIFFPFGEDAQHEVAANFCGSCVVQDQCLEFALETRQDDGVWGNTTEKERRRIRKAWLLHQQKAM